MCFLILSTSDSILSSICFSSFSLCFSFFSLCFFLLLSPSIEPLVLLTNTIITIITTKHTIAINTPIAIFLARLLPCSVHT